MLSILCLFFPFAKRMKKQPGLIEIFMLPYYIVVKLFQAYSLCVCVCARAVCIN